MPKKHRSPSKKSQRVPDNQSTLDKYFHTKSTATLTPITPPSDAITTTSQTKDHLTVLSQRKRQLTRSCELLDNYFNVSQKVQRTDGNPAGSTGPIVGTSSSQHTGGTNVIRQSYTMRGVSISLPTEVPVFETLTPLKQSYRQKANLLRYEVVTSRGVPKYVNNKFRSGGGNIGWGEYHIDGVSGTWKAASGVRSPYDFVHHIPATGAQQPILKPYGSGYIDRSTDTEIKMLETLMQNPNITANSVGTVTLYTERPPCRSCSKVIKDFEALRPRIKVTVQDTF